MGWDGMGWDGMGWDGMEVEGMFSLTQTNTLVFSSISTVVVWSVDEKGLRQSEAKRNVLYCFLVSSHIPFVFFSPITEHKRW
jgi:hypothetical protein